jgi:glutaredoxin-like protein NrdH
LNQLIVYTQTPCRHCDDLKLWLAGEGIPYETRNISENATFKTEALDKGAMGMPFTVIGEETFGGFNQEVKAGILAALAK